MSQPYPITGIADAGIQPRLEIRDLQKNSIQFSLFIQALNKILDLNSGDDLNNPISWWQIGGIHGLPFQPWSGDPNGQQSADPNSSYGGYCYHASALFPTWHRVLMLLTEQAIVKQAIEIATELEATNSVARTEKWVQAAKELRHPFWDWTKRETAVQIAAPGDSNGSTVNNPLNHYNYPTSPGTVQGPIEYMGNWTRTYRWVDNGDDPQTEQYNAARLAYAVGFTEVFDGERIALKPVHWLRGKVDALFQYPLTLEDSSYGPNLWGYFSNTAALSSGVFPPVPAVLSSLEDPHNMVHLDTGGNGSMAVNEYAAFDPIFYLHHASVDRIYAFWEYVYPDYWIGQGWKKKNGETVSFENSYVGNYQQDPDAPIDETTPLIPFRNDSSNYWTSDNVRGLLTTTPTQKYYTYPAITDPRTGVEVKVDVPYDTSDTSLREQYQQALLNEWDPDLQEALQGVQRLAKNLQSQHRDLLVQKDEPGGTSRLRHFVVQAHLPEFAFSGSHRLELYVRPKNAPQTVHVINSTSVLARGNPEKCAACKERRAAGSQVRGYMPVDPRIIPYLLGQLNQTELAAVTDLDKLSIVVKESLRTRVVKPDGTPLAVADPHLSHQDATVLEAERAPELTLHSHYIAFDHNAYPGAVKFEGHTEHGHLGDKSAWKVL